MKLDKARIERAENQRLCIESDDGEVVRILGTRNIIYDVQITNTGVYCSCPDNSNGHICKHIIYILIKRYKANINLDLSDILKNLVQPEPKIQKNIIHHYDDFGYIKPRLDNAGECSICLDILITAESDPNHERLDWCKFSCGNMFHWTCIQNYKKNLGSRTLKCPLCREAL